MIFNFQISDVSRALVLQILRCGTNTSDSNTLGKGSCVLRHEFQNNYTTPVGKFLC